MTLIKYLLWDSYIQGTTVYAGGIKKGFTEIWVHPEIILSVTHPRTASTEPTLKVENKVWKKTSIVKA